MRVVARLLSLVLVALAFAFVPQPAGVAAPVEQCEAFDITDAEQLRTKLDGADTVLEGRVTDVKRGQTASGQTRFVHTVRARVVYSGDIAVDEQLKVITFAQADDGVGRLQTATRYVIFGNDQGDGSVLVEPCSGTTSLDRALHDAQVALIETLVQERDQEASEPTPRQVLLAEPPTGVDEAPSYLRLAGPGAAISVVGLLGLLLVIALGARRPA